MAKQKTDQASTEDKEDTTQETIPALFIKSRSPDGFRRCGFGFTKDGFGIALDALEDDQIKILKNDPDLIIEVIEIDTDKVIGDTH